MEIDVPWIPDDVRDRGHLREEMQQLFRAAVASSGAPSTTVRGDWPARLAIATRAIESLFPTNSIH
jgi:nicotinamide riboside kinase